ncbi:hypothetical protein ACTXT7_013903 [Hymenolepis weldensis]
MKELVPIVAGVKFKLKIINFLSSGQSNCSHGIPQRISSKIIISPLTKLKANRILQSFHSEKAIGQVEMNEKEKEEEIRS